MQEICRQPSVQHHRMPGQCPCKGSDWRAPSRSPYGAAIALQTAETAHHRPLLEIYVKGGTAPYDDTVTVAVALGNLLWQAKFTSQECAADQSRHVYMGHLVWHVSGVMPEPLVLICNTQSVWDQQHASRAHFGLAARLLT